MLSKFWEDNSYEVGNWVVENVWFCCIYFLSVNVIRFGFVFVVLMNVNNFIILNWFVIIFFGMFEIIFVI